MKSVKEALVERRSVRRYEREAISDDDMRFIYEAIRNTPTSYNGQQFTVIDITDQDTKLRIEALLGQKQVKTCAHFMVFCADYHKISILGDRKGLDVPEFAQTVDGAIVGIIDASLAMMSAIAAAEALGLGTCPIGYARTAAPEELSKLLGLPQGVMVVCGLAIGVPRETPDLKPKEPVECVIHAERYQDDDYLLPLLEKYDSQIKSYNATRAGGVTTDNDWCDHILDYYREAMTYKMRQALAKQGFSLTH